MTPITSVADLRVLARRRIPRALFGYVDSGSYDEITLRANAAELARIRFRQRVLIDTSGRSMATTLVGQNAAMPLAIAPTGLTGLIRGDGEILGARAAEAAGIPFCLSTMSIATIEDVRAATTAPFWFQLYVLRDRDFSRAMIERARAAECPVLVVTVDLPTRGQRHADLKNGLTVPPRITWRNAFDLATKPAWGLGVLRGKRMTFGNIEAYLKGKVGLMGAGEWSSRHFDQTLSWADMAWIRDLWPGRLVLKGILDPADAEQAVKIGADAIVVSNHGGRQLDGAPATVTVLPEIVAAVGGRIEVLFDGGVRSGQDVMRALALGARGCLIGRAWLYGLAAQGQAGVAAVLDLVRRELDITMMLTGTQDLRSVSRDVLYEPDR
ncbi:alpha-hydroxy acid oxidase [Rhodoplanes sp. TEM]|uniref:Alpha-hydroxy acid oxidase n=1 Tax=Rhodoplanes tepidamans TaxID=200616 RepID=A0ABT5J579_RHOTP|nr:MULTISPECIES: alpha-hydroxy acid oxidase [Rhodoplanes]MDC7784205.1 alpha-hydroxy acid oxidase [Rhodoplanes tepidamans]MDC7988054.1 alpha-hydroxy acid oxidase [Rhodoplanes sp. TEM]MDQ0356697.1 L-lactate dehydrogenase (cytochrome) [Rhodoplanes tepidamans]